MTKEIIVEKTKWDYSVGKTKTFYKNFYEGNKKVYYKKYTFYYNLHKAFIDTVFVDNHKKDFDKKYKNKKVVDKVFK